MAWILSRINPEYLTLSVWFLIANQLMQVVKVWCIYRKVLALRGNHNHIAIQCLNMMKRRNVKALNV